MYANLANFEREIIKYENLVDSDQETEKVKKTGNTFDKETEKV